MMIRSFTTLVALGLAGGVAVAQPPAPPKPLIEQIEDAWKARAQKVKTVVVKLDVEEFYPKGSISKVNGISGKVLPTEDGRAKFSARLVLDGLQFRLETDGVCWNGSRIGQTREVALCGPTVNKRVEEAQGKPYQGYVPGKADYFQAMRDPYRPLVRHLRGGEAAVFGSSNLADWRTTSQSAIINGAKCTSITQSGDGGDTWTLWLDPTKEWSVTRETFVFPSGIRTDCDYKYTAVDGVGPMLAGWTARTMGSDRTPLKSQSVNVVSSVIDVPVSESEWILTFKPGTRVHDEKWSPSATAVIQPDGSYAPSPGTSQALLDQLREKQRWTPGWMFWLLLISALLLSASVLVLCRRRSYRRVSP